MAYKHIISTDLGQIELTRVKGKDGWDVEIAMREKEDQLEVIVSNASAQALAVLLMDITEREE